MSFYSGHSGFRGPPGEFGISGLQGIKGEIVWNIFFYNYITIS